MLLSLRLPSYEINLAIDQNSLGRFSKRIVRLWSKTFQAVQVYHCLVSGSFHNPPRLLFNFHSHYYCAIGLGTYLGLDVHATHIPARYPTHGTLDTPNPLLRFPLPGYHRLRRPVPEDFELAK